MSVQDDNDDDEEENEGETLEMEEEEDPLEPPKLEKVHCKNIAAQFIRFGCRLPISELVQTVGPRDFT